LSAIRSFAANRADKKHGVLNQSFGTGLHSAAKGQGINMSVLKEVVVAVVGVYALLLACDALFGVGETRFEDSYYSASFYAPRPQEFRFKGDTPPATRVSDAFAQFSAAEAKPNKRYSSLTTIIR
jgi:hypothetical protein